MRHETRPPKNLVRVASDLFTTDIQDRAWWFAGSLDVQSGLATVGCLCSQTVSPVILVLVEWPDSPVTCMSHLVGTCVSCQRVIWADPIDDREATRRMAESSRQRAEILRRESSELCARIRTTIDRSRSSVIRSEQNRNEINSARLS